MKDRLSIEKKYESLVVDRIDDLRFLGLDKVNSDRIDLFMFAMALGVIEGERTPIKTKLGWILKSSAEKQTEAMAEIRSLWIQEAINTNQEDKLDDMDEALELAEEYANTGFKLLFEYLNQKNIPNEYTFIKKMDNRYDEIFVNGTK